MIRQVLSRRFALATTSALVFVACLVGVTAAADDASAATTRQYCDTTPLTGIGGASTATATIDVGGITGAASSLTVDVRSLIYTMADGNVIRLKSPTGSTAVLSTPADLAPATSNSLWGDFTFDDAATRRLPGGPGTYRPSQPLAQLLDASPSPNGRWELSFHGIDPTGAPRGQMQAWCLTFGTAPVAVPTSTTATLTPTTSAHGDVVTVDPEVTGTPPPTSGAIDYRVDGGAWVGAPGPFGAPFALAAQSPGIHVVEVRYTDPTGTRATSTSVPLGFTVTARGPSIAMRLSSAYAVSRWGWYRAPVTATFTCSGGGASVSSCSNPVTLAAEGVAQRVGGTVVTVAGDTATVAEEVSLDRTAPTVQAAGVRDGHAYRYPPSIRCVGADALSGLADCRVVVRHIGRTAYRYRAVAVDRAGNRARDAGLYFRR